MLLQISSGGGFGLFRFCILGDQAAQTIVTVGFPGFRIQKQKICAGVFIFVKRIASLTESAGNPGQSGYFAQGTEGIKAAYRSVLIGGGRTPSRKEVCAACPASSVPFILRRRFKTSSALSAKASIKASLSPASSGSESSSCTEGRILQSGCPALRDLPPLLQSTQGIRRLRESPQS